MRGLNLRTTRQTCLHNHTTMEEHQKNHNELFCGHRPYPLLEKGVPEETPPLICLSDFLLLIGWMCRVMIKLLMLAIICLIVLSSFVTLGIRLLLCRCFSSGD